MLQLFNMVEIRFYHVESSCYVWVTPSIDYLLPIITTNEKISTRRIVALCTWAGTPGLLGGVDRRLRRSPRRLAGPKRSATGAPPCSKPQPPQLDSSFKVAADRTRQATAAASTLAGECGNRNRTGGWRAQKRNGTFDKPSYWPRVRDHWLRAAASL